MSDVPSENRNLALENLERTTGILVSHYLTTGNPELLARSLRTKLRGMIELYHPLSFSDQTNSSLFWYENGQLVMSHRITRPRLPETAAYFFDFIITLWALRKSRGTFLFIGADALNALSGVILRTLRKTRFVILYSVDLPVRRFGNPLLNLIYHRLNIFSAEKVDCVWDLSPRMHLVRQAYKGKALIHYPQQLIVPATYRTVVNSPPKNRKPFLFFVGHIRDGLDLSVVIKSMHAIRKEIPDSRLLVVGDGPGLSSLKERAREEDLSDSVVFYGRIEDDSEVDNIGLECSIGVAPYTYDLKGIPAAGDSGKLKQYAALALPSITTSVPSFAAEIESSRAGMIVPLEEQAIARAAISLLENPMLLHEYSTNAIRLAARYSTSSVLKRALTQSLTSGLKSPR